MKGIGSTLSGTVVLVGDLGQTESNKSQGSKCKMSFSNKLSSKEV